MSEWCWDNLAERERVEQAYCRMIHQQYIDSHPFYIPCCECHPETRKARIMIQALSNPQGEC